MSRDGLIVVVKTTDRYAYRFNLVANFGNRLTPLAGYSYSEQTAISGDGAILAGFSAGGGQTSRATQWAPYDATLPFPVTTAGASFVDSMSSDGSSFTGRGHQSVPGSFIFWQGQVKPLPNVPGGGRPSSAFGSSADGRYVLLQGAQGNGNATYLYDATANQYTCIVPASASVTPVDLSDDANTVLFTGNTNGTAYLWRRGVGLEVIPARTNVDGASPRGISPDGKLVVGTMRVKGSDLAFIWSRETGMRSLAAVMESEGFDESAKLATIRTAYDITTVDNRLRILGSNGTVPWIVSLHFLMPDLATPGVPVDLNGSYLAAKNTTVSATTDRHGLPVVLTQSSEPGTGYRHLPFFPRKLPMPLDGLDLRGKAYGFDVDLGAPDTWPNPQTLYSWTAGNVPEGGEGATLVVRAASSAGTGPIALADNNGLRIAFFRKDGKFFAHVKNLWYSQDVVLPGATVATKYSVRVDVNAAGAVKVCFTQADGTGFGAKTVVDLYGGSTDSIGLTSASFAVQMLNKTTAVNACATKASVSAFWTTAATDALYAFATNPYVDTLGKVGEVTFGLYTGALTQKISAYQASLVLLGGGTGLSFFDGKYENDGLLNLPNPPVFAPNQGGRFDHAQSTKVPELGFQSDRLLETLIFRSPVGDFNTGRTRLRVLSNYGASGLTRYFGGTSLPFAPRIIESNDVVLDAAAPVLGNPIVKQNGTVVSSLLSGTVDVSVIASDNGGSGLGDAPIVTATLTTAQSVVTVVTVRLGSVDPATGAFGTTLNIPLGTKTLALTAKVSDRVGHETTVTRTVNVAVPASPTLSIPIQLGSFAASGNVTRTVRVVLGRQGGDGIVGIKSRIVINKVVAFDKTGKGTISLTKADGLPEFADAGITHVSLKDPYHTVVKRLPLTLTGTTYSVVGTVTLLPGDLNNDNVVDGRDLTILKSKLGTTVSANTANLGNSALAILQANAHCDLNGDGKVDAKDEAILNANFGRVGDLETADYK